MIFEALILGGSAILSTKNVNDTKKVIDPGTRLTALKADMTEAVSALMERITAPCFKFLGEEALNTLTTDLYKMRQHIRICDTEKEIFMDYNTLEDITVNLNGDLAARQVELAVDTKLEKDEREYERKLEHVKRTWLSVNDLQLRVVYKFDMKKGKVIIGEFLSQIWVETNAPWYSFELQILMVEIRLENGEIITKNYDNIAEINPIRVIKPGLTIGDEE